MQREVSYQDSYVLAGMPSNAIALRFFALRYVIF